MGNDSSIDRWIAGMLLCLSLSLVAGAAMAAQAATRTGIVDNVQWIDTSLLGTESFLILTLEDGKAFQLPGSRQIAAGAGVEVEVSYRPPLDEDSLPEACVVIVTAVPIIREGEEILQSARRPFEVYRHADSACPGTTE